MDFYRQFLPQAAEVKVMAQPQRLLDTAPLSNQPNGKLTQRENLANTDRVLIKKGSNNENYQSADKPVVSTKGGIFFLF